METIVKIALFSYSILAGTAIFLLWQNAAGTDSMKNTGILFASIIPVTIALFQYFKTEKLNDRYRYVLIYDSHEKSLIDGGPSNPYLNHYLMMFANLSAVPDQTQSKDPFNDFMGSKGADIVEYGILAAIQMRYGLWWDIVGIKSEDAIGRQFSWGKGPAQDPGVCLTTDEIRKIFADNTIVANPNTLVGKNVCLPPKSKIRASRPSGNQRLIQIESKDYTSTISIAATHSSVLQSGVWGIVVPDDTDMNRYIGFSFDVTIDTRISPRVISQSRRAELLRWHQGLADTLSGYDWSAVSADIEKEVNQKAAAKILGLPYGPNFLRTSSPKKTISSVRSFKPG